MKSFIFIALIAVTFANVSYGNGRDSYDTKSTDKSSERSIDKFTDRFLPRFTDKSSNDRKSIDKSSDDKDTYSNGNSNGRKSVDKSGSDSSDSNGKDSYDRRSNDRNSVDKSDDSSSDSSDDFKIIIKSVDDSKDGSNGKSTARDSTKNDRSNGNRNSNNGKESYSSSSGSESRDSDKSNGKSNGNNRLSYDKINSKSNGNSFKRDSYGNDRRSNDRNSVHKSDDSSSSSDSSDDFKIIIKSVDDSKDGSNDKSTARDSDRSNGKSTARDSTKNDRSNGNRNSDNSYSSSSGSESRDSDKGNGKSNGNSYKRDSHDNDRRSNDRNSVHKSDDSSSSSHSSDDFKIIIKSVDDSKDGSNGKSNARDSTKNDRSNGNRNNNGKASYGSSSGRGSSDSDKSNGKSNGNNRLSYGKSNSKSNGNSHKRGSCDDISSDDNEIFGDALCGTLVSKYDGHKYDEARQQYSTLNEDGNIRTSPNYILTPDPKCDDDDIELALKYAKMCNYKVGIRSGGHQYNGLSSCDYKDNKCIQIDMANYDNCDVLDTNIRPSKSSDKSNNGYKDTKDSRSNDRNGYGYSSNYDKDSKNSHDNDRQYRYTIIEAGPGLAVDDLWTFLKTNNIFFPTDSRTALGAQIVSGGSGNLLRFGTAADYVIGFEIILADGEKYLIENPDFAKEYDYFGDYSGYSKNKCDSYKHNDELYAAVLGGGPGSFGIVTNIYLKTFCDYDFMDNIYWELKWEYTPSLFKKVGYQFADLFNSDYYRNDPNKYVGLDVTEETVTYYGWWVKIDNDKKYKFNDNIIEDFRKIGDPKVKVPLTFENSIPYNQVNYGICDEGDWQWEQPMLNQKQYAYNKLDYDVIDIINDKVNYVCENPKLGIRLSPGSLRITDEKSSHSYAVREDKDMTAQQNRDTEFAVFMETLQYDTKMNKYSHDHAIDWMDELFRKLMKTDAFDDEDIRKVGFTNSYDKFSMVKEWDYYFESESEYNKVRYVKMDVDEKEMFNANEFAIPAFKENGDRKY